MESTRVLEEVIAGHAKPGWAVFSYSVNNATKNILFRLFYLALSGFVTATFIMSASKSGNTHYIYAGIFGLIDLALIISILNFVRGILNAKHNLIVCTDTEVIKSLNGKITSCPYESMKNLRITNPMAANMPAMARRPEQFVDFNDNRTGEMVALTHNRIFGPPELIFNFLNSKLN